MEIDHKTLIKVGYINFEATDEQNNSISIDIKTILMGCKTSQDVINHLSETYQISFEDGLDNQIKDINRLIRFIGDVIYTHTFKK